LEIDERIHGITPDIAELLSSLPFWINYKGEHIQQALQTKEKCCFNHLVGLPTKQGKQYPLFDYETDLLFPSYEQHDRIWILKSRGLGLTTFTLRYILFKCFQQQYYNTQVAVITGTKWNVAIDLIGKLREILRNKLGIWFDTSKSEIVLPNNVWIKSYPSNHLDAFRGQTDISIIFIDEGDFFGKKERAELMDVITSYREKSDAKIIMVSTPNQPGGIFEKIDKDLKSPWHKLKLDYTYGIDKIYTPVAIEEMKRELIFEREYNLKYLGLVGNAFHPQDINAAMTDVYNPTDFHSTSTLYGRSIGVDEGFGSSEFGVVITQFRDNMIEVIYAETFDKPLHNEIIEEIIRLNNKHHVGRILVDASNAGFVASLKQRIGDMDYKTYVINERVINDVNDPKLRMLSGMYRVFPVNFGKTHKDMLHHTYNLLKERRIRIHPSFNKLEIALRTAQVNELWNLDKEATSYDDLLDSFRLALLNYHFVPRD
jgi:hypothetical protein